MISMTRLQRLRLRIAMRRGHAVKLYAGWIFAMAALHVGAMMAIERMGLSDALWVTATTAVTVGYGDVSAKLPMGRAATMLLMYCGTIFVLPGLASLIFERASERRARRAAGTWRWKLSGHILIISTTATETTRYVTTLVRQIRDDRELGRRPVMLMTHAFDQDGLPEALNAMGVALARGDGDTDEEMRLCSARTAHLVVVLGDNRTPKADALVFDVVSRVRAAGFAGRIVSECEDDRNRARLATGPLDASVRPTRGYPEMMARAILAPGAERIVEEIFTAGGGVECEYVEFPAMVHLPAWRIVVARLLHDDLGTAVGYRAGGRVVATPPAGEAVDAEGIYVLMATGGQETCRARIAQALTS